MTLLKGEKQIPIPKMTELEFALAFQNMHRRILEDPIQNFIRAPGMINFKPTPAQTVALKCIFGKALDSKAKYPVYQEKMSKDGKFDLISKNMTETQLYEMMTEFPYEGKDKVRNRINLIVGRRAGKSTLSAILAIYSAIKINWRPLLKKTPVATVAVLSHSIEFSQEILDIIKGLMDDSEVLSRLRDSNRKNTQSTFHLKVPFVQPDGETVVYSNVAIKVGAASKKTTRGRAVCTLLCDEIAYWSLDKESAEPDHEILRAIRPALMQFGQHGMMIKLSSPAIKQGVLYDEWKRREELKEDYIQFKSPSWVWNTILPVDEFKNEFLLDPEGFDAELRANFVDSISDFISPEFVDLCIMKGIKFIPPTKDRETMYFAAIDAAFKGDRFAFSLVGINEKRVTQYCLKTWEGSKKAPVQAAEVAQYIRQITKEYGVNQVAADQYAFQPLKEIFGQFGVTLVENTFSIQYKRKIYFGLKRLIHNNQIDLLDEPILAQEIKQLQVKQTPSGQISIGHPEGRNMTDDCMPADTLIKTATGYIPICDIRVGDLVYTHKGHLRRVLKTFEQDYDTELYTINPYGQANIQLTKNHPMLVSSKHRIPPRKDNLYTERLSWQTVDIIKKNTKIIGIAKHIQLGNLTHVEDFTADTARSVDVTTSDFGLLLGYFLGDGWAIRREKSLKGAMYQCNIAFNNKDVHIIHKLKRVLANYGIKSNYRPRNGGGALHFHSKLLWSIFVDCYTDKREKKLPGMCYTHKIDFKKLIIGWLLADGNKHKPHGGSNSYWVGCSTSKRLALEINDLAGNLGLPTTILERTCHRYGKPSKNQFWITFKKPVRPGATQFIGDYKNSRCRISSEHYVGKLYNLHVAEDESYIANGIVVHNCSDATAIAAYIAMEHAGMAGFTSGGGAGADNDYGIQLDVAGKSFTAPAVEMLNKYKGFEQAIDNTGEWVKDSKTGEWKHVSEIPNDSDEFTNFLF